MYITLYLRKGDRELMDELMDLLDDSGMLFLFAMAQEILSAEALEQTKKGRALFEAKVKGLQTVNACAKRYEEEMFDKRLIIKIVRTKCKNILSATTVTAAREAATLPKPQYSYGQWLTSPMSVPEEELLLWAMVSPNCKLADYAVQRYMDLFREVYGKYPNEMIASDDSAQ